MMKLYEAWEYEEGCAIAFGEAEAIKDEISQGVIPRDAKLLHQVEAATYEDAMVLHYIKMGWDKYTPPGEAIDCPHSCGGAYFPEGSGECPNCGRIC